MPAATFRRLAAPLAFALAAVWLCRKVVDYDIWFHLLIGKQIAAARAIPTQEFYVYPALGAATGFHEWGFDLLAWSVLHLGGFWGLSLLNAAICAGALTLLAAAAVRRGASWTVCLLLLAPAAGVAVQRFNYRPEIALYLAASAALYALERRWLLLLPLLTLLLACFHPSGLIVILVIGCRFVDLAWEARRSWRQLAILLAVLAASALSVALAPYGLRQLTLPLEFLGNRDLIAALGEFAPSLATSLRFQFIAVVAAAALGLALSRPRRASDALLLAVCGALAFAHVRNLALFALVAFGPAALGLQRLVPQAGRVLRAGVAVLLAAATVLFVRSPGWGAGEMAERFPDAAADFIAAHRLAGRLFNTLATGGFFAFRLFPEYLVAVDGRTYYGAQLPVRLSDQVLDVQPGWDAVLAKYGVTMIATPTTWGSGRLIPLVAQLDHDRDWVVVVREPAGLLFLRREGLPAGVTPLSREAIWRQVLEDTDALAGPLAPADVLLSRGFAHFRLHDFGAAAEDFAGYQERAPADRDLARIAGLLKASVHGDAAATATLEEMYQRGRAADH